MLPSVPKVDVVCLVLLCAGDRLNGSKLRFHPHSEIGSAATMRVINILKNWILNKWEVS